jgi:hypothetical protein
MRRMIAPAVGLGLALAAVAAPAQAAPQGGETFDLMCDNGQTYSITTNNGNGDWTPGFFTDGTHRVIVPTSFGEFHFMAVAPDGTVLADETEPGTAKGKGHASPNRPTVTCSFSETLVLTEDDPESGFPAGTTLTFDATVTGFLTGRR